MAFFISFFDILNKYQKVGFFVYFQCLYVKVFKNIPNLNFLPAISIV